MNSIDSVAAQSASRTYIQNTENARTAGAVQPAGKGHHHHSRGAQAADSVTLSDNAVSLANARTQVTNAPDVRQEKVNAIKQQISDGTYQVSPSVLARKMLGASAANDLA
jgi:flagellar biosynthesis anti-sigma factor FlgM